MIKIYEVIAIECGLPLFFERHIKRFELSLKEYTDISYTKLLSLSIELVQPVLYDCKGYNLKLIYCVEKKQYSVEKVISRKPSKELYLSGAQIGIFPGERDHPLIKRENLPFKKRTEEYCIKNNLYDVLLISHGLIPEGSRSNFLLITDKDQVITSPIGDALNGITRDVIFEICREKNIPVLEKKITLDVIKNSVSLIITGTSPELLPIIKCDDIIFKINTSIINQLQTEFKCMKKRDIERARELFS